MRHTNRTEKPMQGMTKEQQDLVNRIFNLVERVVVVWETDAMTRRMRFHAEHPVGALTSTGTNRQAVG